MSTCEECGKEYEPKRGTSRFCSAKCRAKASRLAHAQKKPKKADILWSQDGGGYIYVVQSGNTGRYKIGHTAGPPVARIKDLQVGSPDELILHEIYSVKDVQEAEARLHRMFREQHIRGEWFFLTQTDLARLEAEVLNDAYHVFHDEVELRKAIATGWLNCAGHLAGLDYSGMGRSGRC